MRPVVIGVTGSVGTGKSTVAKLFEKLGAAVLDADAIAREVVGPGKPAWRDVVRVFGWGVLDADGAIDRQRLAQKVFSSPAARRRLERIVHPRVMRTISGRLARLKRAGKVPAVVLDIPLLVEVGAQRMVDVLVVVTASRSVQVERLRRAYGWPRKEVESRIAAQWNLSAKVAMADEVIDNSQGVDATRKQVKEIWNNRITPRRKRRS